MLQIGDASCLVWEKPLKSGQRLRKEREGVLGHAC
jgi:hypothetical protein